MASIPHLPDGYSSRPATLADVDEVARVINAAGVEMDGKADYPADELRNDMQVPGLDLAHDTRIAIAPNGEVAAYADAFSISDPPVHPFTWGRVHPDHRNRGLGTALLGWSVSRAREAADRVPEGVRISAESMALSTWAPSRDLLTAAGFTVFRHNFDMEIGLDVEPPAPVWPEGVTIRPMRHPEEDRAVHAVLDEAFRDHFGHVEDEPQESAFARFEHFLIKAPDFDPTLWFVAESEGEMIGLTLLSERAPSGDDSGWVGNLGVLKSHRRRGLGRALLLHSFHVLRERGKPAARLSVDGSSLTGAVRLYEKAGMRIVRQKDRYELELRPGRELAKGR